MPRTAHDDDVGLESCGERELFLERGKIMFRRNELYAARQAVQPVDDRAAISSPTAPPRAATWNAQYSHPPLSTDVGEHWGVRT